MAFPISKGFGVLGDTLKNGLLNGAKNVLSHIGVGNTDERSTIYTTLSLGNPSGGTMSMSSTPVFTIPQGTTIKYITLGEFNAIVGWLDVYLYFEINDEFFQYNGTLTIDSLTLSISDTIG